MGKVCVILMPSRIDELESREPARPTRVGSRGMYLIALGCMYLANAYTLWSLAHLPHPPYPRHIFGPEVAVALWAGVGVMSIVGGFCRRDWWAYLLVLSPPAARVLAAIISVNDLDRDLPKAISIGVLYLGWMALTAAMATTTGTRGIPTTLRGWPGYRVNWRKGGPRGTSRQ